MDRQFLLQQLQSDLQRLSIAQLQSTLAFVQQLALTAPPPAAEVGVPNLPNGQVTGSDTMSRDDFLKKLRGY